MHAHTHTHKKTNIQKVTKGKRFQVYKQKWSRDLTEDDSKDKIEFHANGVFT